MAAQVTTHGEELLPIGAAARVCGVATSALRYYEDRGLVTPARRTAGRRWYGREELRRIVVVQLAQSFGMSLQAIATYLNGDRPAWHEVLDAHLAELEARVACAESAREFLTHARQCPAANPLRECDTMINALDAWIEHGLPGRSRTDFGLGSAFVEQTYGEPPSTEPGPPQHLDGDPEEPGGDRSDLGGMRRRYAHGALDVDDLATDPLDQFRGWLDDALAADVPEPNAMVLATAGADGVPSARTVLLKGLDARGFAFFTNLESAKAAELDATPRAALVFPWHAMERQVRVSGSVTRIDRGDVAAYFATRPRDSQLGAWASPQSSVVPDRAALDQAYADMAARWPEGEEIPPPDFWGGYRVRPLELEFWQGRQGRLHDRFRYRRTDAGGGPEGWTLERLAP